MWNLNGQGMGDVDMSAVLKGVNPSVYQEWIERGAKVEPSLKSVVPGVFVWRFDLNVQDGMVVVGLRATVWSNAEDTDLLVLGM